MIPTKLKKTIVVLGLAVPLICFAVGEIDNETLSVTATLPSVITLTFLNGTTIALGNLTASNPPVSAPVLEPFCVGYDGGILYSVEAHSAVNPGGVFALTRGGDGITDPIAMTLTWDPIFGFVGVLSPNVPSSSPYPTTQNVAALTLNVSDCPGDTNGDLLISIDAAQITGKAAGSFSDSISITVTGQ